MFARLKMCLLVIIFVLLNVPNSTSKSGQFFEQIWTLKWNSHVDLLAVNGGPNGVKIYDNNLDEVVFLTSDFIHDVAWSPDGRTLALVESGGTRTAIIKIWDLSDIESPQLARTLTDTRAYTETIGIDWHPTQNLLAVSGNGIRIWDLDTETPIFTSEFGGLTNLSYDVKWSSDGKYVAGLFLEGIKVWETEGQLAWFYHEVVSKEMIWSPDNTFIAAIRSWVNLIDVTDGQLSATLIGEQGPTPTGLSTIEWAGQYIIGAGHDNKIYVWNTISGELEQTFQNDVFVSAIEWIPETGFIVHKQGDTLEFNEDIVIKPTIADLNNEVFLCLPDDTKRGPLIQLLDEDNLDRFLEAIATHPGLDDACLSDLQVMVEAIEN